MTQEFDVTVCLSVFSLCSWCMNSCSRWLWWRFLTSWRCVSCRPFISLGSLCPVALVDETRRQSSKDLSYVFLIASCLSISLSFSCPVDWVWTVGCLFAPGEDPVLSLTFLLMRESLEWFLSVFCTRNFNCVRTSSYIVFLLVIDPRLSVCL